MAEHERAGSDEIREKTAYPEIKGYVTEHTGLKVSAWDGVCLCADRPRNESAVLIDALTDSGGE